MTVAMPESYSYETERTEQTRDEANAWVARFAPLVMTSDVLTAPELHDRLNLVNQLREEAPSLQSRLSGIPAVEDHTIASTFNTAYSQLDSVETELRNTLARLSPGDAAGLPDLDALNDRLAERKAREELGLASEAVPAKLEMVTSPVNWAQAGFFGLFAFGWLSFTTFHAFMMIGGLIKAIGYAALALLGFYAIFFAVGFGMLAGAVLSATKEVTEIDGHTLTIRRKIGPWLIHKSYQLSKMMPSIEVNPNGMRQNNAPPLRCITMTDVNGKAIRFASGTTEAQRQEFCNRITAYLRAQPTDSA